MNLEVTELTSECPVSIPEHAGLIARVESELTSLPYSAVSFKMNLQNYSDQQTAEENFSEFPAADVIKYLTDYGVTPKYATMGLHLEGSCKRPHIHFTIIAIMSEQLKKAMHTNASGHRKRWRDKMAKQDYEVDPEFRNVSMVLTDELDRTKASYECLAYPLKEGKHVYDSPLLRKHRYFGITREFFEVLLGLGTTIYEQRKALHLRQDKCEERKQNALADLQAVCETGRAHFSNLREMAIWLDTNYIATLDIAKYPDPKNYKVNLQKIAVHLKIARYSDFI